MKQRRFDRKECRLEIRVRAAKTKEWFEAEVLNISLGGALVRCNKTVFEFGELVEIEVAAHGNMRFPATVTYAEAIEFVIDEQEIEASEVRWSDNAAGLFGVRFEVDGSKIKAELNELIGRLTKAEPEVE